MTTLNYKSHAQIEDLGLNECTIHRASGSGASRWWLLWFHVLRDSDGQAEIFCVPVNPLGAYTEQGPGGRTWGLNPTGPSLWSWQISPSINVLDDRDAIAGTHDHPSLWHQTPTIVGVSTLTLNPWVTGSPA